MKNIIYFDTNIIQHSIQFLDREKLLELHTLNKKFYSKWECLLVSQVENELNEHWVDVSIWLWSIVNLKKLPNTIEYSYTLHQELYTFFNEVLKIYESIKSLPKIWHPRTIKLEEDAEKRLEEYKHILSDIYYYFYCCWNEWFYWINLDDLNNQLLENDIDYSMYKTSQDVWMALWMIIEKTKFWEKVYYWLTYRDINRMIGNFMFDYKNYKLKKSDIQKHKVGKDALVIMDLIHSIYQYAINIEDNKLIFITSDYSFYKELVKFKKDINDNLLDSELYSDLSDSLKDLVKAVIKNLRIIKLDINDFVFENELWIKSKIINDLI